MGWIRRFYPAPDAPIRLVCFPHAGSSATFYYWMARTLAPDIEVLAVQYPGRQDRLLEPMIDRIDTMADLVMDVLPRWLDRPTALFGHSMGATLAFEVARRLTAAGRSPTLLFASGRTAPSQPPEKHVHDMSDEWLLAELAQLDGTDDDVLADAELVELLLPAVRNDYQAVESYRFEPGPPLTCPLVALIGHNDPKVSLEDGHLWGEHTTGDFTVETFPGGHFFLVDQPDTIMSLIRRSLRAAMTPRLLLQQEFRSDLL